MLHMGRTRPRTLGKVRREAIANALRDGPATVTEIAARTELTAKCVWGTIKEMMREKTVRFAGKLPLRESPFRAAIYALVTCSIEGVSEKEDV